MVLSESLDKNIELALRSRGIQLHTSCPLDRILLISTSSTANNSITINHSPIGKNSNDTPFNLRPSTIDNNTISTLITGVISTRIIKANIIISNVPLMLNSELTRLHQIASPRFEDMTPAEQARYEYQLRRQRHQMHHQHLQQHRQWQQQQHKVHRQEYQHHHWLQAPHGHNTVGYHHGRAVDLEKAAASSAQDLGYYPSKHQMSKGRTANELAWERHCYYQQQQHQEETVAELRRKEIHLQAQQARQQHQLQQEARSQPPEPDAVVRASSLNSITPASLAEQATRDLGLSRSKSVNVSSGRNGAHSRAKDNVALSPKGSGPAKSIVADCPILSAGRRLLKRNASKSIKPSKTLDTRPSADKRNELVPDPTEDAVGEQISLGLPTASAQPQDSGTTLTRRRTLKNIAPSIRSLARRCSSRFSSRPNSYAGSNSDPITQFMDGKAVNGGLDVGTSQMPQPLIPGPDGIVDLRQAQSQDASTAGYLTHLSLETSSVANSNINTSERIPIHRKVTLFRSKTTSARSSVSRTNTLDDDTTLSSSTAFSTDATNSTNTTVTTNTTATTTATTTTLMRAKSLSARPRDSLRLANGRGLDLSFATNPQPAYPAATTPAPAMQDTDRSKDDLNRALPGYWNEEQEAAKRQVMGILAMGRKERVSAKTGQAMAVRPVSKTNNSGTFLSPLALEAQDDLALQASSNWNKPKPALEEDPCQRIAFMLVPKSRYEFQPLVMA
ncbi:hypothetical protein BGX34_010371 [Mortierella sp. NVP85]|nr:hypothetical protein BGX34_010371 [Mortierella sp. NVP85]